MRSITGNVRRASRVIVADHAVKVVLTWVVGNVIILAIESRQRYDCFPVLIMIRKDKCGNNKKNCYNENKAKVCSCLIRRRMGR